MPYVANAYTTVVLDLYEELALLIEALDKRRIDYAICGIAMAVWDVPRATVDIDLLIEETDLEAVKTVAASRGYVHEALPMRFADGAIDIRRISKTDSASGDILMLDILLVTPQIRDVWDSRKTEVVPRQWERPGRHRSAAR
jgi:hypothetical protein